MAYAPPDPKKVKAQREAQERDMQVESCYRQYRTGQERYRRFIESDLGASLGTHLGIDVTVRLV